MKFKVEQKNHSYRLLGDWFSSDLGQALLCAEQELLEGILNELFGYYLVQMSPVDIPLMCKKSPVSYKVILTNSLFAKNESDTCQSSDIIGDMTELPLRPETFDVALLSHVLDFTNNPHRVLREVEQSLIPGGHAVIVGFNPWSAWGVRQKIWRNSFPWHGRFIAAKQLADWLALLNIQIKYQCSGFYRFPMKSKKMMSYLLPMESLGEHYGWLLGGFYILVGCKSPPAITPLQAKSFAPRLIEGYPLVKPSARIIKPKE